MGDPPPPEDCGGPGGGVGSGPEGFGAELRLPSAEDISIAIIRSRCCLKSSACCSSRSRSAFSRAAYMSSPRRSSSSAAPSSTTTRTGAVAKQPASMPTANRLINTFNARMISHGVHQRDAVCHNRNPEEALTHHDLGNTLRMQRFQQRLPWHTVARMPILHAAGFFRRSPLSFCPSLIYASDAVVFTQMLARCGGQRWRR